MDSSNFGWTADEDALLHHLVHHHGPSNWSLVSRHLPGRSAKSCRLRWCNHLSADDDDPPTELTLALAPPIHSVSHHNELMTTQAAGRIPAEVMGAMREVVRAEVRNYMMGLEEYNYQMRYLYEYGQKMGAWTEGVNVVAHRFRTG